MRATVKDLLNPSVQKEIQNSASCTFLWLSNHFIQNLSIRLECIGSDSLTFSPGSGNTVCGNCLGISMKACWIVLLHRDVQSAQPGRIPPTAQMHRPSIRPSDDSRTNANFSVLSRSGFTMELALTDSFPLKLISLRRSHCAGLRRRARAYGEESHPFKLKSEVLRWCPLSSFCSTLVCFGLRNSQSKFSRASRFP